MTAADLTALLASDLGDPTNRLVLADALEDAGRAAEAALCRNEAPVGVCEDGTVAECVEWTVHMTDDTANDYATVLAPDLAGARKAAEEATRGWIESGDWGEEGATVDAWWAIMDGDEELWSDSVEVDIEPNHDVLIRRAGGDPDCDHDWGDYRCYSNGGTSLSSHERCLTCGLKRIERSAGSQRDPGQASLTVEYVAPSGFWCAACQEESDVGYCPVCRRDEEEADEE